MKNREGHAEIDAKKRTDHKAWDLQHNPQANEKPPNLITFVWYAYIALQIIASLLGMEKLVKPCQSVL